MRNVDSENSREKQRACMIDFDSKAVQFGMPLLGSLQAVSHFEFCQW